MSNSSELSKVYSQYQESLQTAQSEYTESLKQYAGILKTRYDELLKDHICTFEPIFSNQLERLYIKRYAENFFGTSEIPFVAIDGSCFRARVRICLHNQSLTSNIEFDEDLSRYLT